MANNLLKLTTSCLGYEQITSLSSTKGLTLPAVDANGMKCTPAIAIIIAEAQGVRWRDDGTAPTASVGMPLPVNTPRGS